MKGVFKTWRADIRFDPEDLSGSSVAVEIETGSADTAYADRDKEIRKADWFAIDAFPAATFTAETFRKVGDGAFEAEGALSIKGVEQALVLPFTLQIDGGAAAMKARSRYPACSSNWAKGSGRRPTSSRTMSWSKLN